jgi:hypothetical protein
MARGWESKTVESQIETAQEELSKRDRPGLTRAEAELQRKRDGLLLSRKRVLGDLAATTNERRRRMLQDALAHLDKDIAALDE